MKTVAVVQARMGSKRFPGKVLKPIDGVPMMDLLLERLARADEVDDIVIATTLDASDDPLVAHLDAKGYRYIRGSEQDVLGRFVQACRETRADAVVRITADCPLVDDELVDQCIRNFKAGAFDYYSNTDPATFPDGLDIEVVKAAALERANDETGSSFDREHVTPYVRQSGGFSCGSLKSGSDHSSFRWTVDEPVDLEVITAVFRHFKGRSDFGWKEVLELQELHPEIFTANQHLVRNEGATMGTGQKLWKRAKQVIPGGNMLLSKRAEMFLPDQWPAYFEKSKGCQVWDLDGNVYKDMSIMGVGTNTLGYGHPEVDDAVRRVVELGNMSTFNAPEEVYLAEKLVALHPWFDMVRFARTGGEANAVAIRIARAASGRGQVAICGYHGWHDWYLSANLSDDKNLDGHLLPGLAPKGVPRELQGTVSPFHYNRIDELKQLIQEKNIGVIMMEVSRNAGPENDFLQEVRNIATAHGIVLIFDECTSGFRQTFGGLHKQYGVKPDMAIFGKALGNGYAITAVLGTRDVMEVAQETFISSTFWTERIGSAAALKTLEVMERVKSWEQITDIGNHVRATWQQVATRHGLEIDHWGLPALCGFTIRSSQALAYKTLITQEMLRQGFLASNGLYACIDHTRALVDEYADKLDGIFATIRQCEDGLDVHGLLHGPVCHSGFSRLN